jgi:serine/threonine-protein kinase
VGEKLDVATVLEGSVRRSGSRLRITVQLVNAADGYQLWSERYDREVTDVFEVQDEIAGAIAAKLKVSFHGEAEAPRARHGTASLEAYELFLKGRALQQQRRQLWQAIAYFEQAIALDPDYVEALAWQADSYRLLGTFGAASFGEVMPRARELAERALAIDPTQAEALTTLADVHAQYDRDFARAEPLFTRALEIDPRHSRARCERALWGHALGVIGGEDAVREIAKAVDEDPLNAWATTMLTMMLCSTARYDEAVAAAERAVAIDHDSFVAHFSLVEAYGAIGKLSRAVAVATPLLAVSGRHPWAVGLLGWVYARLGDSARARAMYDELEARSRSEFVGPFWIAIAASAAGLDAEAMHNLGRAVREREPLMVQARMLVFCDRLRANPRFDEVTRGVWQ